MAIQGAETDDGNQHRARQMAETQSQRRNATSDSGRKRRASVRTKRFAFAPFPATIGQISVRIGPALPVRRGAGGPLTSVRTSPTA